jgi:hypothetical protein
MVLLPIAMVSSGCGAYLCGDGYSIDGLNWNYLVIWVFEVIALTTRAGR